MEKSKTFCAMPFVSTMVNSDGKFKYCCIAEGGANNTDLQTDGKTLHASTSTLLDAWNSDTVKEVRRKMIAGEQVDACMKCDLQNKIGREGYRDMMTKEWIWRIGADKMDALVKEAMENDGVIESSPVYLDLRLGNLCNFRCRMCNPYSSSAIAKEHFDLWDKDEEYQRVYKSEYGGSPVHLKNQDTWFESDLLWSQVESMIPTLKKVYMTGGEPTLIENNYYFMEKCIEEGRKDIVMFFNTNCSNVTEKFTNVLSKFDRVDINASLDGYGDMNNYIRYPSHWEKISTNFEKLASMKNIHLGASPVVQLYNIFDIDKIIDYVADVNDRFGRDIFIDFLIDTHPKYLDIKILPQEIKDAARLKLETYIENNKNKVESNSMTKNSTYAIVNLLKEDRIPGSDLYLENFLSYTKILDKNRKQTFEDVCVELNEHLNAHYAKQGQK